MIEDVKVKRRRKVQIDGNKQSANMETIIRTQKVIKDQQAKWNRLDRAAEVRRLANEMLERDMEFYMHEWHAAEVIGGGEVGI